jgi:hypothetical protein
MRLGRFLTRPLALALVLVALGSSQAPLARGAASLDRTYLAIRYDLDRPDTNPVFCKSVGLNGGLGSNWGSVPGRVTTSGSSTTVTEKVTGELPFAGLSVGDVLKVNRGAPGPTTVDIVAITAKASGASITVDTAVNWSGGTAGSQAFFRQPVCGQAATDGWFSVGAWEDFTVVVQFQQGDLGGGLDWRVECRDGGDDSSPVQVFPATLGGYQNIPTAGYGVSASNALAGFERWNECRVALFANTSDTSDAGANLERIRVIAIGTVR